ncbi:uncharacterized protein LOC143296036 [Babylonia areolata]|uniref:uncharacterized protein LOC143296036 n=1 Tax=Babylonia areolata TaxID=304850 RepID=UPI003FD36D3F
MATGGAADRTVEDRFTCCVCSEPYKGRQPKFLPCYHTFCLPCLNQLTRVDLVHGDSITCPICRGIHTLPPGGASSLPTNFYVDHSDPVSPVSQPAPAMSMTQPSDDLQTKVKEQVNVMEAVVSRLSEEEKEIERQRRVVELDVRQRYEIGLRMLGECRDQCLTTVEEAAGQLTDKLQADHISAHSLLKPLQELAREGVSGPDTSHAVSGAPSALLSNPVLRHFRQLSAASQQPPPPLFLHSYSDNMADLTDSFRQFMGTVVPSGGAANPQLPCSAGGKKRSGVQGAGCTAGDSDSQLSQQQELRPLQALVHRLQTDLDQLREEMTAMKQSVHNVASTAADVVQKDASNHQQSLDQIDQLREELTAMKQSVHDVASTAADVVQKDASNHQQSLDQIDQLREELTAMKQQSVSHVASTAAEVESIQKSMADVQKDASKHQQSLKQTDTVIKQLQSQMNTIKTPVFFNARLTDDKDVSKSTIVKLEKVVSNTGRGYNATTGIFTAPLSATYLFLATARADSDSLNLSRKYAVFDIVAGGEKVACSWSRGPTSCTAHAVVRLQAGDQVYMKTVEIIGDSTFRGNGHTSFCGVLLHAQVTV